MDKKIAILGLGWLGYPLALQLEKKGFFVKGSVSSPESLKKIVNNSLEVSVLKIEPDTITGNWASFIKEVSVLIINFPPKRIDHIETIHPLQIEQIIKRTPKTVKVIFVSSTSVYQSTNGLVNETLICKPEKASGHALIAAETLLKKHFQDNLVVLRLAGLIGPKRHPGRFLSNKKQLKNPNGPINLIHQVDAIRLIEAIISKNCFGEIINGCADIHPTRKTFYSNAAVKLNLPVPVFDSKTESSFKKVDNSKSKALLNFEYEFYNPERILN